jgi:hypothetical protein
MLHDRVEDGQKRIAYSNSEWTRQKLEPRIQGSESGKRGRGSGKTRSGSSYLFCRRYLVIIVIDVYTWGE